MNRYNPCFECNIRYGHGYTEACEKTCAYAKVVKEKLAKIDAEDSETKSKKGKWISEKHTIKKLDGTEYTYEGDPVICSNCGEKYTKYIHGYEWDITDEQPRFCPSCGKEMETEE